MFFAFAGERIFIKTHTIEIRFVIGPGNILFSGACVHFQLGIFTCWGSEGVKRRKTTKARSPPRGPLAVGTGRWSCGVSRSELGSHLLQLFLTVGFLDTQLVFSTLPL